MKILTVLGARPQFIKAGSVSRAIRESGSERERNNSSDRDRSLSLHSHSHAHYLNEVIVHTGQHYDENMNDVFFEQMKIPKPDYNLGVKASTHASMTGQMMEKIEEVALKENPDWILVYGDTNSTLAGALVAAKLHIKLAHVEAGLRSFNMKMPEEVNRILTDRISTILFCPTETAVKNLKAEGFPFRLSRDSYQRIVNVGDVMLDGALFYKQLAQKPQTLSLSRPLSHSLNDFILCSIHRAENTDDPERLNNIFDALNEIAEEKQIILPLHPRTRKKLSTINNQLSTNIVIIDPVGYLEMVWLLEHCCLVMTDSGGLQKEAYFFNKLCITLRDETKWVELVESGANILAGADKEKIVSSFHQFNQYTNTQIHKYINIPISQYTNIQTHQSTNLYGDGKASEKIVKELLENK